MTLKQKLRTTQVVSLLFGIIMLAFMLAITNRIKLLEQEKADNYIRIQREISDLNKKVQYSGG